ARASFSWFVSSNDATWPMSRLCSSLARCDERGLGIAGPALFLWIRPSGGRSPDNQFVGYDQVSRLDVGTGYALHQQPGRDAAHFLEWLADGRQIKGFPGRHVDVVIPDDPQVVGHGNPHASCGVPGAK